MAYRNLDEFLIRLEQSGELVHIPQAASPILEIAAITENRAQSPHNAALWFDQVNGGDMPVVTNLFNSEQRMTWALGLDSLNTLTTRLTDLLDITPTLSSLTSQAGAFLNATRSVMAKNTPAQAVHCAPDVMQLPVLHHWPLEPYPTITQAQLIIHALETGHQRVRLVAALVQDAQTLLVPYEPAWDGLTNLPACIVLGGDPLVTWCAGVPLPDRLSPYWLAAWLRNKPVAFTTALTQDIRIPADAEIIIEGRVNPAAVQTYGPLAAADGFYTSNQPMMPFHITALTHRQDAIYPASIMTHAPSDNHWMMTAAEHLLLPALRFIMNEVVNVHLPAEGAFYNLAIVSIRKQFAGQAQKVIFGLWGMGEFTYNRAIIVVDAQVDVTDYQAVAHAVLAHVDWERDCVRVQGTTQRGFGGKIGVDATADSNDVHQPITPIQYDLPADAAPAAGCFWHPGLIVVAADDPQQAIHDIWASHPTANILALQDTGLDLTQPSAVMRYALANVDWQQDILHNGQAIAVHIKDRLQALSRS